METSNGVTEDVGRGLLQSSRPLRKRRWTERFLRPRALKLRQPRILDAPIIFSPRARPLTPNSNANSLCTISRSRSTPDFRSLLEEICIAEERSTVAASVDVILIRTLDPKHVETCLRAQHG